MLSAVWALVRNWWLDRLDILLEFVFDPERE